MHVWIEDEDRISLLQMSKFLLFGIGTDVGETKIRLSCYRVIKQK